ncbi:MAG: hypothetical protein ACFFAQ_03960 [Promethearchaeota archaeon]
MNETIIDSKLKYLIQVCKETQNYRKLAVSGFILISNKIDEFGIKLGLRPRNKEKEEKIFEYIRLINDVFESNLKLHIFKEEIIDNLKKYEIIFLRSRGDVPYNYIKKIFLLYYELRKLDIPNLHEQLKEDNIIKTTNVNLFSFLSPRGRQKRNNDNKLKPLILHKVKEKEIALRETLNQNFNSKTFEQAIYLKKIKKGLEENGKNKIVIQGALKDNINYQLSLKSILGYFILGLFLVAFCFGFIVLIEMMLFPFTVDTYGLTILLLFGVAAFFLILYWQNFRGE